MIKIFIILQGIGSLASDAIHLYYSPACTYVTSHCCLQAAKLASDVSDLTKEQQQAEMQLERHHKLALYKQVTGLKSELSDKKLKLEQLTKQEEKLRAKVMKLKIENNNLTKQ